MDSLYVFCIYYVGYFILHSILTTDFIKAKFNFRWYRLLYNIIAILTLAPIIAVLARSYNDVLNMHIVLRILGVIILLFGMWVQKVSFNFFSKKVFWGIEVADDSDWPLVTDGLYKTVRHPLYFGALMIFWSLVLIFPNIYFLSFSIISTIYIWIGSRLEENKLINYHPEYKKYRAEVPSVIPYRQPIRFFRIVFGLMS